MVFFYRSEVTPDIACGARALTGQWVKWYLNTWWSAENYTGHVNYLENLIYPKREILCSGTLWRINENRNIKVNFQMKKVISRCSPFLSCDSSLECCWLFPFWRYTINISCRYVLLAYNKLRFQLGAETLRCMYYFLLKDEMMNTVLKEWLIVIYVSVMCCYDIW